MMTTSPSQQSRSPSSRSASSWPPVDAESSVPPSPRQSLRPFPSSRTGSTRRSSTPNCSPTHGARADRAGPTTSSSRPPPDRQAERWSVLIRPASKTCRESICTAIADSLVASTPPPCPPPPAPVPLGPVENHLGVGSQVGLGTRRRRFWTAGFPGPTIRITISWCGHPPISAPTRRNQSPHPPRRRPCARRRGPRTGR